MKKIIMTKVADLRKHPSYALIYAVKSPQFDQLVTSIEATGELLEPIVITSDNVIISGVQRWLAYQELNWELIPAIIYDGADSADQLWLIISSNQYRIKSTREKWNEIQYLKQQLGKKQGQRTDLLLNANADDKLSTRSMIAIQMGISEGNVYKIEKVAEGNPNLMSLIDTKEISLHEAYKRICEKPANSAEPSAISNGQATDGSIECCSKCKRPY